MSDAVLELQAVTKSYNQGTANQIDVLRGVDLTLNPGEMVALVAPSGAGKSTLLHIAGLLDVPDGGRVTVAGQDISGKGDGMRTSLRRQKLGFVYQFHHLLPEFTALENIVLPQLANGIAQAAAEVRAVELLALVGLSDRARHRPAALSGGEQQTPCVVGG
jgi:lipoprotein-releasing system ATP-binding protein